MTPAHPHPLESYAAPLAGWTPRPTATSDAGHGLVITDLSKLPRTGFKGRGTIPEMQRQGVTVEPVPNRAFPQSCGSLCLVLGASEVMLLANPSGGSTVVQQLEQAWSLDAGTGTYLLPRQHSHCWLNVSGPATTEFFAKICAIDLRPAKFADLTIAQTSVARLNTILVRADVSGAAAYHLLADSASAIYFADCLVDAAREFNGRWIGER